MLTPRGSFLFTLGSFCKNEVPLLSPKMPWSLPSSSTKCSIKTLGRGTRNDSGVLKLKNYNEKVVRGWIVECFIIYEMPFRIVQQIEFRKLITRLKPHFKMPSRYTCMKHCMELYIKVMTKLKEAFVRESLRVCFTTNTWTSIPNINYVCGSALYW